MTDNEIIKALECLAGEEIMCKDCAFSKLEGHGFACRKNVSTAALDLINRQKAEKEALINGQETLQKYIAEQNSEISILKDSNINLQELYYTEREKVRKAKQKVMDACKMLKTAKSEAIKEFAKRLKYKTYNLDFHSIAIDNLVKEMVGE